jgi:hypothetical protein
VASGVMSAARFTRPWFCSNSDPISSIRSRADPRAPRWTSPVEARSVRTCNSAMNSHRIATWFWTLGTLKFLPSRF